MAPDDPAVVSYRLAVERMKALPTSDPRNWSRIAQIHVDFCPHQNWFFLPWHRAYLIAFERICRQVLNDPEFALPYWDWTEQRTLPPAFAEPTVGGRPNSLFDSTRVIRPDEPIPAGAVAQDVILRMMAETGFENFGSTRPNGQNSTDARWLRASGTSTQLEFGPHGVVHTTIGGDMGDMGSPLDPIFFLHHCNIDRLWAWWNAVGRRNMTDRLWTAFRFNGIFQTPQGQGLTAWNVGVSDMLDHLAWGYTYPDLPGNPPLPAPPPPPDGAPQAGAAPPVAAARPVAAAPPAAPNPPATGDQVAAAADAGPPPPARVLAVEAGKGSAKLNTVMSTRLTLLSLAPIESRAPVHSHEAAGGPAPAAHRDSDPNAVLRETPLGPTSNAPAPTPPAPRPAADATAARPAADTAPATLPDGRIFSILENIKTSGANTVRVNVFLNHPNPTAATPESDPHFVGTFGLFGLRSHATHGGASLQLELTRTIANLRRANVAVGKQLDIQLIPVAGQGNAPELMNPERIRIVTM
jgi:hypothetical protein